MLLFNWFCILLVCVNAKDIDLDLKITATPLIEYTIKILRLTGRFKIVNNKYSTTFK